MISGTDSTYPSVAIPRQDPTGYPGSSKAARFPLLPKKKSFRGTRSTPKPQRHLTMSYARPSPRPGELYNRYAPPRPPPMENVYYAYSRSEAGGTRPGRPPPRYPMAEPYYRGASTRPAQRPSGYANSSYHAPGSPPPSTRRYNNEPSQGGYWV